MVGARAQLLCKRISWGSCYNADSDSADLRWGREVSNLPRKDAEAAGSGTTLQEAAV